MDGDTEKSKYSIFWRNIFSMNKLFERLVYFISSDFLLKCNKDTIYSIGWVTFH